MISLIMFRIWGLHFGFGLVFSVLIWGLLFVSVTVWSLCFCFGLDFGFGQVLFSVFDLEFWF